MKISIVTPSFNSAEYIRETLDSVLLQKGEFSIEYLVIDGGSEDSTPEILEEYRLKVANGEFTGCREVFFDYVSEPDNGMYDAVAKGFEKVTGDIIAYINSDDYYLPHAFELINRAFENIKALSWVTGINVTYNSLGNPVNHSLPFRYDRKLISKGLYGKFLKFIQQESVFFSKELLEHLDLKKFREFSYAGDFFLWSSFAERSELRILRAALSGFRTSENQLSVVYLKEYMKEFEDTISGHTGLGDYLKGFFYRLAWYLPDRFKIMFNSEIIDTSSLMEEEK